MHEKFRQRMEEKCKQDPQKCEEWKKHHERGDAHAPAAAPAAVAPAPTP
jgi:hypothetical protein